MPLDDMLNELPFTFRCSDGQHHPAFVYIEIPEVHQRIRVRLQHVTVTTDRYSTTETIELGGILPDTELMALAAVYNQTIAELDLAGPQQDARPITTADRLILIDSEDDDE